MFTKQTRAWSAVLVVCMLLSLLATFALPVSAEEGFVSDEVIAEDGLVDTSTFADISNYSSSVKNYKISNRAGFEALDALVMGGNTLAGVSIYLAADIDMGWKNFSGIGQACSSGDVKEAKNFSGKFYGNGFTIDNLYIVSLNSLGTGLFNTAFEAEFHDLAIASGLIIGNYRTASFVGGYTKAANLKFYNCWSAATVITGGNNGAAGLASNAVGESAFYNCAFLGMLYTRENYAAGLTAFADSSAFRMENCYTYASIISGMNTAAGGSTFKLGVHSALFRPSGDASSKLGKVGSNNYYWNDGRMKSTSSVLSGEMTADDDGMGLNKADFATQNTADKLNGGVDAIPAQGQKEGYVMKYTSSAAGYPVITYFKDGEIVSKRIAHTTTNVGENTIAEKSPLFKKICDNLGSVKTSAPLGNLKIDNANDLFVLSWLTAFRGANNTSDFKSVYGLTGVTITEDIDMKDMDIFPIDTYVPLGAQNPFNVPIDGGYHVIKNWKVDAIVGPDVHAGADNQVGFVGIGAAEIKNLGLVEATVELLGHASILNQNKGTGLFAGYTSDDFQLNGCFATGSIIAKDGKAWRGTAVGGLVGIDVGNTTTINGSWCDVDLLYQGKSAKLAALGDSDTNPFPEERLNSVYYVAEEASTYGNAAVVAMQKLLTADTDPVMVALEMNQANPVAVWGVNNDNTIGFSDGKNTVVGVFIQKTSEGGVKAGDAYLYKAMKPGEILEIPAIEGYEISASTLPAGVVNGKLVISNSNVTLNYIAKCFDINVVRAISETYSGLQENLFTADSVSNLKAIKGYCKTLVAEAESDKYTDAEKYLLQQELENLVANTKLELVGEYPYIPGYSLYNVLKDYNTSGVWGISTKEDWLAVTSVPTNQFKPKLELHLTNDIDMENELSMPLYYGGAYSGTIDGHGYAFKNLNVSMTSTDPKLPIGGIVSRMSGGTIKNLGIESGTVNIANHNAASDDYGIGLFCGWAVNASYSRCWAGEKATLQLANCKNDSSYGVIVGRGANTFDACYSYCKIITNGTPNHVSHLGDWATNATRMSNSFGVTNSEGSVSVYMYRANGSGNNVALGNNLWIVGGTNVCHSTAINNNSGKLSANAVKNGELAYKLWANYTLGKGSLTYFTVEDGKTVFGTAENQYYAVVVKNGSTVKEWYGKPGTKVDISSCGIPLDKLQLVEGSVGTVDGYNVVMGKGNTEFVLKTEPVEPDPGPGDEPEVLDFGALKTLLKKIGSFDVNFFVDADAMKAKYEEVNSTYKTYTTQAQINAAIAALGDLYVPDGGKILPASISNQYCKIEGNAEYPMIGIYTADDLKYVASNVATYTSAQTLYLCADLDASKVSFTGLPNLKANFNGQNHVITKFNATTNGFFDRFAGKTVENLVFRNCHISTVSRGGALVVGQTASGATAFRNITVEDCSVTNAAPSDAYNVAIICGGTAGNDVFENITVRNSEVKGKNAEQTAIFIGAYRNYAAGSSVVVKNVLIDNCANNAAQYGTNAYSGYEAGLFVGKWEGNMSLDVSNLIMTNCSTGYYASGASKATATPVFGALVSSMNGSSTSASFRNVVAYNNETGHDSLVGIDTVKTALTNASLYFENVYSDAAYGYVTGCGASDRLPLVGHDEVRGFNQYATSAFENGAAIYAANKGIGEDLFAVADGGVMYADEENAAPTKQAVQINGVIRGSVYTDNKGKLNVTGWEEMLKIADKIQSEIPVEWMVEGGDPAALTYTEDGSIIGACCYHEWVYDEGKDGIHVKTCDLCGGSLKEDCVTEWVHKNGTHGGTCTLCEAVYTGVPCDWVSIEVIEQDCENVASEKFECSVCKETKVVVEPGSAPLGHATEFVYNTELPGTHHVTCTREGCGYSELENCSESANPTIVKPNREHGGYTEWTCEHCEGKWKTGVKDAIVYIDPSDAVLHNGATEGTIGFYVANNCDLTALSFNLKYNVDELIFKSLVLTEEAAAVADLSVVPVAEGVIGVTITAKEGMTTKIDANMVEAIFEVKNTAVGFAYEVEVEAVSAYKGAVPATFEADNAQVKMVAATDVNTDGVLNTVDLSDMLKYLLNKETVGEIDEALADLNKDGVVDLLDAVDLAKLLAAQA